MVFGVAPAPSCVCVGFLHIRSIWGCKYPQGKRRLNTAQGCGSREPESDLLKQISVARDDMKRVLTGEFCTALPVRSH